MPHYLPENLLSQKQATVYLALLRLGPATILETSKEAGIRFKIVIFTTIDKCEL